jgi:phosphonoacetaldehyde hydrolase
MTIGITRTGNEVGLTAAQWQALPASQKSEALAKAATRLREAGAHYLAENVEDGLAYLDEIDARVAGGERP